MAEKNEWIAACGLNCETCSIRKVPEGGPAAEPALAWFRKMGWLKEDEGAAVAAERKLYCRGCFGSRNEHWSADCWILKCCVDDKKLRHCSDCSEFPCQRIEEWGRSDPSYAKALEQLKRMRA